MINKGQLLNRIRQLLRQEQLEAKAHYAHSTSFADKSKAGAMCKGARYKQIEEEKGFLEVPYDKN